MEGMATWFTADLHLGHENIIRYCERPFADAQTMDRSLVQGWNHTVGADDTVWVLGDVALGKISHTLPLVSSLSGRKLLVAGNHDRCWAGHGRRAEGCPSATSTPASPKSTRAMSTFLSPAETSSPVTSPTAVTARTGTVTQSTVPPIGASGFSTATSTNAGANGAA